MVLKLTGLGNYNVCRMFTVQTLPWLRSDIALTIGYHGYRAWWLLKRSGNFNFDKLKLLGKRCLFMVWGVKSIRRGSDDGN